MRATIDYGIDLGTSNSAVAVQDGALPRLLPGDDGAVLLPSAVHIRADGGVVVGDEAMRVRPAHPDDTAVEFKRQMGTTQAAMFPASGRRCSAEELSAEVLRVLARRAERADGRPLRAAVITVPAMFQLAQCEATGRAAGLAGIEHAPLLQEPIAAAIAHSGSGFAREGHWLVYDFGGGTFDVSLVRSRAGRLQVLDHDGDNHLGGKDLNRVLARWAAERVREEGRLGEFRRSDPALAPAFVRLAAEAERVRIALSERDQVDFEVPELTRQPDGEPVGFRRAVDRELLETLISPVIVRTTELCKTLLSRNRLTASGLKGIVLVGGPTRTPALPRIIERELGLDARHQMDPTTIVAAGAALFASTQKLPPALRAGAGARPTGAASLELEYESMTTNPAPLLVGRAEAPGDPAGLTVRVVRDGEIQPFDSGHVAVSDRGVFTVSLRLREGQLNAFRIEASRDGGPIETTPSRFSILHGMSVAKPPLSQSVGVMLADNSVCWYLRKGAVLPARNTVTHATTQPLKRGESGDAIKVPLVQGESDRADRNKIIGVLCIHAHHIPRDLPAGTEIQVTLSVDEFSRTEARGYVPWLDRWFDEIVRFESEEKSAEQINVGLNEQQERLKLLEQQAAELESAAATKPAAGIDERAREVESLIAEGDRDSIELAEQMLRLMTRHIDRVEAETRTEGLRTEFRKRVQGWREFVTSMGRNTELDALDREFNAAMERGDMAVAESKRDALARLTQHLSMQTIDYWMGLLQYLHGRYEELNLLAMAGSRFEQGVRAANNDDIHELSTVCFELINLLPREERGKLDVPADRIVSNVQ
jgi:molecular chaperone DnaK